MNDDNPDLYLSSAGSREFGRGESSMNQDHVTVGLTEIRVKGHLDSGWSEWFDGLTITNVQHGEAVLSGPIVDQAALQGTLRKIRDLGLPLISVNRFPAAEG